MKRTDTEVRMSYETYAFINALLDSRIEDLGRKYQIACSFIPSEPYVNGKQSGLDKAHKIFSAEHSKLSKMKNELHAVAAATYKNHPKKKMREFWNVV